MDDRLKLLQDMLETCPTAPTLAEMPRNTLADKGIAGPTSAHRIEEVHTPLNFAFTTFTTGSTAMQNIVGVPFAELPGRIAAGRRALQLAGLAPGDELLITYPPLVNVFPKQALEQAGVRWSFLHSSSREALLLALCTQRPGAVLGESSFLNAALADAKKTGLWPLLPEGLRLIAAGTPLDAALAETAGALPGAAVHDLYGCQEFGWLALDGVPLREDITLLPDPALDGFFELVAGGLPMGDSFPKGAHACNPGGHILTYERRRAAPGYETEILATTAASALTAQRAARSILRIKGKIVRTAHGLATGAPATRLRLASPLAGAPAHELEGPAATALFDALLAAQQEYQAQNKQDAAWNKRR